MRDRAAGVDINETDYCLRPLFDGNGVAVRRGIDGWRGVSACNAGGGGEAADMYVRGIRSAGRAIGPNDQASCHCGRERGAGDRARRAGYAVLQGVPTSNMPGWLRAKPYPLSP